MQKCSFLKGWIAFVFFLLQFDAIAENALKDQTILWKQVKTLEKDYLEYDEAYKTYLPVTKNPCKKKVLHFFLPKSEKRLTHLQFSGKGTLSLLINNKIFKTVYIDSLFYISIDKLHQFDKIPGFTFVSLVNSNQQSCMGCSLGYFEYTDLTNVDHHTINLEIKNRPIRASYLQNIFSIGFLFIFFMMVVIKQFQPEIVSQAFSLKFWIVSDAYQLGVFRGLLNAQTLFMLLCCMSMMGFYLSLDSWLHVKIASFDGSFNVFVFFKYVFMICTVCGVKWLIHSFFGHLFKLQRIMLWLYHEFIFTLMFLLFVSLPIYMIILDPWLQSYICDVPIFTYFSISLLIIISLKNLINDIVFVKFQKVFLFSYICVSDILIACITIKFLFR